MNIDTLSIARDLHAVELPREQAEAIAAAIGRAVAESSATKADLALTAAGLKADLAQTAAGLEAKIEQVRKELTSVEHKLEAKIEAAQSKLIMWFVGTQLAFVALIGAILKL